MMNNNRIYIFLQSMYYHVFFAGQNYKNYAAKKLKTINKYFVEEITADYVLSSLLQIIEMPIFSSGSYCKYLIIMQNM